ncbi:hypothetical protein DFH07DRAFT_851444 [Mycena maculata]|uniref:Uncharacterized protein n=1 Tax=Mycena maculata TaxID=230809 RepID=A0AAD7HTK7_9AGAR|nr:hypothetical protein DFH07DRAFT_851444 [Mycena maculata]
MPSSLLARLFCCCSVRPRGPVSDVESAVIPNESSRLLDPPPSPTLVVDHQKFSDRLGTIVRAKEGKMVSVSARSPFTLHSAASPTSDAADNDVRADSGLARATTSHLPPVLTMTPARSHGSLNLYSDSRHSSDSHSQSSSPRRSRSSSCRRPEQRSHSANSHSHSSNSGKARQASEWFVGESGSELSIEEEPPSPIPIARSRTATPTDPQSIAFSWGDV